MMKEWIVWLLIGSGVAMWGLDRFAIEVLYEKSSPVVMGIGGALILSGIALLIWRISKGVDS